MLTNIERETIITFNEAEDLAEVFTFNSALRRRLAELEQLRPADVIQTDRDDTDGQVSVTYTVPKGWVKINPSKQPRILSEEEKQMRRELMRNVNRARGRGQDPA